MASKQGPRRAGRRSRRIVTWTALFSFVSIAAALLAKVA